MLLRCCSFKKNVDTLFSALWEGSKSGLSDRKGRS